MGADDETRSARTVVEGGSPRPRNRKSDPALTRGTLVGRYVVIDRLGEGGMGVVYAAFDPELNRKVALKLVTSGDQERILREAQALARLSHPNVVAIYDVGSVQERVFLAMELVEGETLSAWLNARPRTWRDIVAMFRDAGRGLAAAHAAGIVHRDFKPGNVLVGQDGRARVLDFGLARAAGDVPEVEPMARSSSRDILGEDLTETGSVMGTPVYMPPEAFRGQIVDAAGDQFSFCVALYEALYRERPFDGTWLDPKDPPALRPPPASSKVPTWLRTVVVRGLAGDIAARYPSMNALLAALDADPTRTRRKLAVIGASVLGVAGLVSAVAMSRSSPAALATDPCTDPAPLRGTWDLATRVRVRAGFVATGAPSADANFTRAATALDDITNRWVGARAQTCANTRQHHIDPEAVLLLRLACLDRQKDNIDALVGLLEHPDDTTVKQSSRAIRQLRGPNECAHGRATFIEPPSAAIAPKVAEIRKRLSYATALNVAARNAEAVAVLRPLADEARKLGYGPLTAEVLYTLSYALRSNGDYDHDALDTEAERVAVASRADAIAARVATNRYFTGTVSGKDETTLREWRSRARDWAEREGDLEAMTNYATAEALDSVQRGEYDAALTSFRRAIDLGSQLFGADSLPVFALRDDLALILATRGLYEQAAASQKTTIDELARTYGEDSNDLAANLDNYGNSLTWLGRYAEARAALERGMKIPSVSEIPLGTLRCDLARVLVAEGQFDEAIATGRQGLASIRRGGFDGMNLADNEDSLAAAYLGAKHYNEALAQSRECLADFRKHRNKDTADMNACLVVEGAALVELGQARDALPVLEHALQLQAGQPTGPGLVANLEYQLARALVATRQDLPRARDLVTKARDELAKLPFKKSLLDELDAWSAKHAAELR
jgi:tetratricopeptide (TPR) repeat protein